MSRAHESAIDAAEAVRQLNHQTIVFGWATGPADLYEVLGALAWLASRLPQSCEHQRDYLVHIHARGGLRSSRGRGVETSVAAAAMHLEDAGRAASLMHRAFAEAQALVSDLYEESNDGD